jgi:endonuclease YncB( thermonuclease family)
MAKAIEQLQSGLTIGHFALGQRGEARGSVNQQVHDGDTINVSAVGNFGIRLLGVDAPEISFNLPGQKQFISISNSRWAAFLSNPFEQQYDEISLLSGLKSYLQNKLDNTVANNHHQHAVAAERGLEALIKKDIEELGQTTENFKFFIAFAHQVMDRYGRLLGYVNRYEKAEQRPPTYNERLLEAGLVSPYFIFPNINPFRKQGSIRESVPLPGTIDTVVLTERTLRQAREWVKAARQQGKGIFESNNSLQLEPFELRFLAQRRTPERWVIDLSKNDNILLAPQEYYTIPNLEDRLFIPDEYLPLFEEIGWQRR